MKLKKNHSLALAVAIIALFFLIGIWFLPSNSRTIPTARRDTKVETPYTPLPAATSSPAATATPESKFVLKEFHRFEVRDSRKIWEARGSQGQYFPEQNSARISDAKLWVYREDGTEISLTAGQALLKLQGTGLHGAEASNGVVVKYGQEQTLETDTLWYEKESGRLSAPGLVKITGSLLDITGERLDGDLNTNQFTLKKNVSTVLKPRVKSDANR